CDYRRLALRLQRQQTPLRPRRTHANRVRPTVDHDPPTPSRIATGPPNGSPSTGPPRLSLCESELSDLGDAAPEEVSASSQVTHVALIDLVCRSRDRVVATGL